MKNRVYNMRLLVISLLILAFQQTRAQLPVVKTSVDKDSILIGQQIHYRVSTSMPDNTYRLSWFNIPDTLGNFNVINANKIDSGYANGYLNFTQDIVITSFDSGKQVIPPLTLNAATLDGDSSFNLLTDSVIINVAYSPADSVLPFHDIKNIIAVKKQFPWWQWALVVLAVILLALWIFYLTRFFRKKKDYTIFESKVPPYQEAMESLDKLQKENLLSESKFKEFHTRLSDIFKRYLSRVTNTYQMYLTTDELLIELQKFDLQKEQLASFANSLRLGNAAKFAQYVPPAYENEQALMEIKNMITEIHRILNQKKENGI